MMQHSGWVLPLRSLCERPIIIDRSCVKHKAWDSKAAEMLAFGFGLWVGLYHLSNALVSEWEQIPAAGSNIWRKTLNQKSGGWYSRCPHTFGRVLQLSLRLSRRPNIKSSFHFCEIWSSSGYLSLVALEKEVIVWSELFDIWSLSPRISEDSDQMPVNLSFLRSDQQGRWTETHGGRNTVRLDCKTWKHGRPCSEIHPNCQTARHREITTINDQIIGSVPYRLQGSLQSQHEQTPWWLVCS